jgi:hypothetical protein
MDWSSIQSRWDVQEAYALTNDETDRELAAWQAEMRATRRP